MKNRKYVNPNQTERDREYLARQAERGIVRKTVQVPADKVPELHALCKKWRDAT